MLMPNLRNAACSEKASELRSESDVGLLLD